MHCQDVNDIPFLHLAVAGKVEPLISGDEYLLILAGNFARAIVAAHEFAFRFLS